MSLLEAIEIETQSSPSASVVWLHGLGADGNDFVPIVPELGVDDLSLRFVFPHAPTRPVTINGGMVMRAWYDISDQAIRVEDEKSVRASQQQVEALIQREKARGSSRVVLAGFSQGGAIALHTGLRQPQKLAGILALSCYLPLASHIEAEMTDAGKGTSIFMGHGVSDPVVQHVRAVESRDRLEDLGCKIEWHEYPMPHSVCMEEVRDIGEWLRRVLG
jgi:phospholipase/carboxylesterase